MFIGHRRMGEQSRMIARNRARPGHVKAKMRRQPVNPHETRHIAAIPKPERGPRVIGQHAGQLGQPRLNGLCRGGYPGRIRRGLAHQRE